MKKILSILACCSLAISCGTVRNGAEVTTDDGTRVRVEAVGEGIFHVTAVPKGEKFSTRPSLIIVSQKSSARAEVVKTGATTEISTSRYKAVIDNRTGSVSYFNACGKPVTMEDRREFSPVEVDGDRAWTVRQVFASDDSEGFFGLGQHQADEWNYKGRNEELFQYNTKISVPFVVSSKKYGILWDSYSFCRWGDPRDYESLEKVFTLYDKDGAEGALTGTYVPFRGETLVRREPGLNQEYLRTPQCDVVMNSPEGFNFNGSKVTYEGFLEPSQTGTYRFRLYYAGYTKVFVDGREVMPEVWRTAWNPNARKFEADLQAGVKVPIRIEWLPDGGVSYCGLRALSPADEAEQARMSWWGEMQRQIDYYFIAGDNIDEVIGGYRTLTGKAQIMPKWSLGYWQSRERYTSQAEVVGTLKEFRDRGIAVDNIVQDWQYWLPDQWGSHEFDAARFPDPKGMVDSIHAMNGRFMISVWPKFYRYTEHFKEMDEKGWIYQTAIRDSVIDWLGYEQSFYDAYADGARKLFWEQMRDHLAPLGVDAWWMDASEPNIHDCTDMDYRKAMCGPTALGTSTEYFNAYALMNAQAIYEGQRGYDPDTRVFLLTRNGFAGLQRYSTASWSGDIGTRWEDMKAQISAGLNYSISGIPFWGQDIGGFSVENRFVNAMNLYNSTGKVNSDMEEWMEMQARWHEWGFLTPLYRAHGQFPYREPWLVVPEGSDAYKAILTANQMRYMLLPYIYTLAARVHFEDYTMMRPLVMDFPDDPVACNTDDEYLFGDALLVCPVYEYKARSREVYLPEGEWYQLGHSETIEGGRTIVADAPYSHIPIFVRDGQIYPVGEYVQSSAEPQSDLQFQVTGGKDAHFSLYEDEGTNYNYEKGAYSSIDFDWNAENRMMTVGERSGSFEGMVSEREFTFVVTCHGEKLEPKTIKYDGKAQTIAF